MSMHHKIARLEEENRQLRISNRQLRISRQCELDEIKSERKLMESERRRIEQAADRMSATEELAAERERKKNIRETLVEEAKLIGKIHGMAARSELFSQISQTNHKIVEAAPEMLKLPSPEVSFDKMNVWGARLLTESLVKKALEETK